MNKDKIKLWNKIRSSRGLKGEESQLAQDVFSECYDTLATSQEVENTTDMPFKMDAVETGLHCPYCGQREAESLGIAQYEEPLAFVEVGCMKCEKKWTEKYKLIDVL